MRSLPLGFLVLSGCLIAPPQLYVTPVAPARPALAADCPVTVFWGTPPVDQNVETLGIVRCVHRHGSGDACEGLFRAQVCRMGGNTIYGVHPEPDGQAGTVAILRPPPPR